MAVSLSDRIAALEKITGELDNALLGKWDIDKVVRKPGIAEQLQQIRLALYVIGPLSLISALGTLGLPVKEMLPAFAKFALTLVGR
jgi:hypothetical protein